MIAYAEPDDLADAPWSLTVTDDDAARLIAYASSVVSGATKTAVYDVDTDGLPVDATILGVMRDATCAQVAAWSALDVDPAGGGVDAVTSASLGGASYTTADPGARARVAHQLAPMAAQILADAGLLGQRPLVSG